MLNFIIKQFPQLGYAKRRFKAMMDHKSKIRVSYSQHMEDKELFTYFESLKLDSSWKYVDVGANHPSQISNSYLFYRHGYRGVIVEPNLSFKPLYEKYRSEDTFIACGCAEKAGLLKFNYSKTPVLSSFSTTRESEFKDTVHEFFKTEYLPVFPLNEIIKDTDLERIFLLSIDTEGFNLEALKGLNEGYEKILSILVEFEDESERKQILDLVLSKGFEHRNTFGCNLFFVQTNLEKTLKS